MPMIKRGDGSTGHIVEAIDGDGKGMCTSCGHIFAADDLSDGKCGACTAEPLTVVEAMAEDEPKSCCCGCKKEA